MRRRQWILLLFLLMLAAVAAGYWRRDIESSVAQAIGLDNPNLPRIKRTGGGDIVIEIPKEEDED